METPLMCNVGDRVNADSMSTSEGPSSIKELFSILMVKLGLFRLAFFFPPSSGCCFPFGGSDCPWGFCWFDFLITCSIMLVSMSVLSLSISKDFWRTNRGRFRLAGFELETAFAPLSSAAPAVTGLLVTVGKAFFFSTFPRTC